MNEQMLESKTELNGGHRRHYKIDDHSLEESMLSFPTRSILLLSDLGGA